MRHVVSINWTKNDFEKFERNKNKKTSTSNCFPIKIGGNTVATKMFQGSNRQESLNNIPFKNECGIFGLKSNKEGILWRKSFELGLFYFLYFFQKSKDRKSLDPQIFFFFFEMMNLEQRTFRLYLSTSILPRPLPFFTDTLISWHCHMRLITPVLPNKQNSRVLSNSIKKNLSSLNILF